MSIQCTYSGVHDACAMGTYGVSNVSDIDGVQVFVVTGPLHKYLKQRVQQLSKKMGKKRKIFHKR